jgi:hypothetical protein
MVGAYSMRITQHAVVQASLRRLKSMGLKVHVFEESPYRAYLFIDLNSVLKLIEKNITYPNKRVYFEEGQIVIEVWKKE